MKLGTAVVAALLALAGADAASADMHIRLDTGGRLRMSGLAHVGGLRRGSRRQQGGEPARQAGGPGRRQGDEGERGAEQAEVLGGAQHARAVHQQAAE